MSGPAERRSLRPATPTASGAALVARIGPLNARAVSVEATGGFETAVEAGLAGAGLPVVVVDPAQARAFAGALGERAKTDPIDAAVIARFADATAPARVERSIRRLVRALERELGSVDRDPESGPGQALDEAVRGSPAWREEEDLPASAPGVGKVITRTLLPSCRSWGPSSTGAGSPRSSACRPGPASPASGAARASSAAGGRPCGRP